MVKIIYKNRENKEIQSNDTIDFTKTATELVNFLKEFNMTVSVRLLNTLVRHEAPATYLLAYAQLSNKDYSELALKMESTEWKNIEHGLKQQTTEKVVNNRFKVYYGHAGTGKTTKAVAESDGSVVVMNENVTPKELVYDFTFENGQPVFVKSAFARAMEEGTTIVLDELNLAPFETIRFLQGVLDNKEQVTIGDTTFDIHPGFNVIGTMNHEVLGMDMFLPEPLVDRASDLVYFDLQPAQLVSLAI